MKTKSSKKTAALLSLSIVLSSILPAAPALAANEVFRPGPVGSRAGFAGATQAASLPAAPAVDLTLPSSALTVPETQTVAPQTESAQAAQTESAAARWQGFVAEA